MNVGSGAYILSSAVSHDFVTAFKLLSDFLVEIEFVSDYAARKIGVLCNEIAEILGGHALQHLKANVAIALHHADHWSLEGAAPLL